MFVEAREEVCGGIGKVPAACLMAFVNIVDDFGNGRRVSPFSVELCFHRGEWFVRVDKELFEPVR